MSLNTIWDVSSGGTCKAVSNSASKKITLTVDALVATNISGTVTGGITHTFANVSAANNTSLVTMVFVNGLLSSYS